VTLWIAIVVAAVGSYLIKLTGLLLPGVPRVNAVLGAAARTSCDRAAAGGFVGRFVGGASIR
jgi:hypothetical protein